MKVTVLGYSDGIQAIDTGNTSLLVQSDNASILVDTSGSVCSLLKQTNVNPLYLDAVCLTHHHIDHIYAYPSLIHNLWLLKRKKPLYVIADLETQDKLKKLLSLFLMDIKRDLFEIIYCNNSICIKNIKIETFALVHRPQMKSYGFVFTSNDDKISYFPDSAAREPYPNIAMNSNVILHEAHGVSSQEEILIKEGHSSARMAAILSSKLKAKNLVLVHLPESNVERENILKEAKEYFTNVSLADNFKNYS